MSEQVTEAPKSRFIAGWTSLGIIVLVLGVLVVVASLLQGGGMEALPKAYFFGWLFWAGVTLGCTGLALLHHVVRAKWSMPMFRLWEAGGGWQMLLVVGLLFAPILFLWGPEVWKWMLPEVVKEDKMVAHKAPYLNQFAMAIRWVIYFGGLAWAMWFLAGLMKKEEQTGKKAFSDQRNWVAPPLLAVYVLFINFAMTDWAMSLDVHWFSTIYGVWRMIEFGICAMCIGLMIYGTNAKKAPFHKVFTGQIMKDQAHMLLAFSMLWAYFALSQYLIIWSGNLPEFTPYYIVRGAASGFNVVGMATIIGSFVVPFLLLIGPFSQWFKPRPHYVAFVAGWALIFRVVDYHYTITPSLHPGATANPLANLMDWGMLLVFGGAWILGFVFLASKKPVLTETHPYQAHEANLEVQHA